MRALTEIIVAVALVACVAAFTLDSVLSAFEAAVTVTFTTFGSENDMIAGDWGLCDGFDAITCR